MKKRLFSVVLAVFLLCTGLFGSVPVVVRAARFSPATGEPACQPPLASPAGGTYSAALSVVLTCATPNATILYTTDGKDPTPTSTQYRSPIAVSANTTLKAVAILSGSPSKIMTETYVFKTAKPVASPAGDTYSAPPVVTLSCATPGAVIHYTTDGSTPTPLSARYTAPITVFGNTTLRAVSEKNGLVSDVMTEVYTQSASAVGSLANFTQKNTYTRGQFLDVDEGLWYGYDKQRSVADAYTYGLMKGTGAAQFTPGGSLSVAEAITAAARVYQIYYTSGESFSQGSPWYQVYVDYALDKGIIKNTDFSDYTRAVTRAEMAYLFSRALPEKELAPQNTVNTLPDVTATAPHYASILLLYRAGVLSGSDGDGTFTPDKGITRAEAAAILSRVILPARRAQGNVYR